MTPLERGTLPGRGALPPRRVDESMSLLTEAAGNPVDPGYAEAALRRSQTDGGGRRRVVLTVLAALLVAVLTTGTVWAARALRAPEPEAIQARRLLEQEITDRSAAAHDAAEEIAALGAEIEALTAEALAESDPAVRQLERLGPAVGMTAVAGPGLVVTLRDSPRAAAGDPDADDERVNYVDLQVLTNGLWQAGAEAISINGHRLTAMSAVRFAGQAILVELTPLVGPYRVEAIGDPESLRTEFARTAASRHLTLLRDTFGIGAEIVTDPKLTLSAAPLPTLRFAAPIRGNPTPSGGG